MFSRLVLRFGMSCFAIAGLFLCSCSAVPEANLSQHPDRNTLSNVKTIKSSPEALSSPTVVTSNTPLQYFNDLERCRASVAGAMGPAGPGDHVSALRRALNGDVNGNTVTVGYEPTDRATIRDSSVKKCLSSKGYIVKH